MIKISTCTASYEGMGKTNEYEHRLELLEQSLKALKKHGVKLAVFPGGYFYAGDNAQAKEIAHELHGLAKSHTLNIAVGIDTKEKFSKGFKGELKKGELPFFACVCMHESKAPELWAQRSITRKIYSETAQGCYQESRTIDIEGIKIEVLMCGEIFNAQIREVIISRKTNVIVDLAHISDKFRIYGTMKNLAKRGIRSFCSVHTQRKSAMKACYLPCKQHGYMRKSDNRIDVSIGASPRLEHAIWEI
ncbi:MAG: hypothetical protein V3U82_00460 [Robiginitomaculum sp.]